jgi:hypothetical protein
MVGPLAAQPARRPIPIIDKIFFAQLNMVCLLLGVFKLNQRPSELGGMKRFTPLFLAKCQNSRRDPKTPLRATRANLAF